MPEASSKPADAPAEHPLYEPARRHWPGVVAALAVAAVVAFVAVNSADDNDTVAPPPTLTEPATTTPSSASPPSSERPTERHVDDTSGAIVTDEQPVDVATPPPQERSPAQ